MNSETERYGYLGEATGRACQSTVLYFIPIESDSSVYEAKRAALHEASTRYRRRAVALMDVSIDYESVTYLVYERRCTLLRGIALAVEPQSGSALVR